MSIGVCWLDENLLNPHTKERLCKVQPVTVEDLIECCPRNKALLLRFLLARTGSKHEPQPMANKDRNPAILVAPIFFVTH